MNITVSPSSISSSWLGYYYGNCYIPTLSGSNFLAYVLQLYPVLLLVTEVVIISLITGFSSSSSILRIAALPFVALCVCLAIPACTTHMQRRPWGAFVGGYSITFLLQYINVALLSKWSFENHGPLMVAPSTSQEFKAKDDSGDTKSQKDVTNSIWSRGKFGLLTATSFRHSGTSYEVKNVPRFSSRDPSYIPSRWEFLRQKAATALTCYLVLDLFGLFSDPTTNAASFSPEMIPFFARLDQVSSQEVIRRLVTTLGVGFGVYCVELGVHSIVAFLDVGLGISEVQQWRPLFGSLKDAYTVRRFWR